MEFLYGAARSRLEFLRPERLLWDRREEEVMFDLLLIIVGLVLVGAFITYDHMRGQV